METVITWKEYFEAVGVMLALYAVFRVIVWLELQNFGMDDKLPKFFRRRLPKAKPLDQEGHAIDTTQIVERLRDVRQDFNAEAQAHKPAGGDCEVVVFPETAAARAVAAGPRASVAAAADIVKYARWIFAAVTCGLLLAGCKPKAYPKIKSDETLRQECLKLLEEMPTGEVAKEKWPKSVAALNPVQVDREENDIRIWTHQERGNYASGYYVFPNSAATPPSQGVWIKRTEFKGVYRFETGW